MSRQQWGWDDQWNAQRGRCWICLQPMLRDAGQHPRAASIEHVVPLLRGGANCWRNKLLAHVICNNKRGAPFIWVKLNVFRRAAMQRLQAATPVAVEGVDRGRTYPSSGAPRRSELTRRPATGPSEIAGGALRVTLAELIQR